MSKVPGIALVLLLLPSCVLAMHACTPDGVMLIIWGEQVCSAECLPGTVTVDIMADMPSHPHALSAGSLRITHLPPQGQGGTWTLHLNADEVTGNPESGLSLIWHEPLTPVNDWELYLLGTIEFEILNPEWMGPDHMIESQDAVFFSDYGEEFPGFMTGQFTFNPSDNAMCFPNVNDDGPGNILELRRILPYPGTFVPSQFDLSFEVQSWICVTGGAYSYPYEGSLSLDGELYAEFAGGGQDQHSIPIDLSGWPQGSDVTLSFAIASPGATLAREVIYHLDESTDAPPVPPASPPSWSLVKTLY